MTQTLGAEESTAAPGRTWWHDNCPVHGWTEFAQDVGGCVACDNEALDRVRAASADTPKKRRRSRRGATA